VAGLDIKCEVNRRDWRPAIHGLAASLYATSYGTDKESAAVPIACDYGDHVLPLINRQTLINFVFLYDHRF
jgi:hypothetical protein